MHVAPLALFLAALPAQLPPTGPQPAPRPAVPVTPAPRPDEEGTLKAAGVSVTGPGLLDFFRKRTPPPPDRERLAGLVKRLGGKDAPDRQQAAGELVAFGPAAVPALRRAANDVDDVEGSALARRCLQQIEGPGGTRLAVCAVRLLAVRKPAGAAGALLAYLPCADNDEVVAAVEGALAVVGFRGGKPDETLVKALGDRLPVRRGTAARVLCQVGGPGQYALVRPLLKDPRPTVRLRAALGLAGAHDAEAIPVLIDLLADLPPDGRKQAEESLVALAGDWVVTGPRGNDALSGRLRRQVWKAWWGQIDGDRLLEEFRARTPSDADREEVLKLIRRLDDDSAEVRQKASDELTALGDRAAPLLRQASHRGAGRAATLAGKCLEAIEQDGSGPLPSAAARLLALRRPEGAVGALLAYLPFAEDDDSSAQIIDLVTRIGCPGGKADEALVRALGDRVPARRAAAATALCQAGATGQLPAVRKLLKDTDADVRLKSALALAGVRDKQALPVLIALLGELPAERAWEVEDYLVEVAGDKAPTVALGADEPARAKCLEAWKGWWRDHGDALDLARVDPAYRRVGPLVVVENFNPVTGHGRVLEVGNDGKVLWEVGGLARPLDARALRNGNVLVVEGNNHITERDRKGAVLWDRTYGGAFTCERLRNGNTWIACYNRVLEVDPSGKEVFSHNYPSGSLMAARRFRDGQVAFLTYAGHYVRLSPAGKEQKSYRLNFSGYSLAGGELLPGDRVLVSVQNQGKLIEFSPEGKQLREVPVRYPGFPRRLPNGRTILPCDSQTRLVELDPAGKVVFELKNLSFRPFKVSRR